MSKMIGEELADILDEIAKRVHENAVEHGFWDGVNGTRGFEAEVPKKIALLHSEASEAFEEHRRKRMHLWFSKDDDGREKPEGFGVELADLVIRALDTYEKWRRECAAEGTAVPTLGDLLLLKHEYNVGRPHMHGGKVC